MGINPLRHVDTDDLVRELRLRGEGPKNAIRRHVVGKLTLIIDNDERLCGYVKAAALLAVQTDMGTGWDRESFVEMLAGRGGTDRREVADVVGVAVCGVVVDWLDTAIVGSVHDMVADVLDLTDREQRVMFGEHYMPEEDDWPADE